MFFWFLMYFFGLFWNRSVCFGCFETGPKHRNIPKIFFMGFVKQTENEPKQIEFRLFRFEPRKKICLFRGHPTVKSLNLRADFHRPDLASCIPGNLRAELGNPQSTLERFAQKLFLLWQSGAFDRGT
jgi:hypothetical protein